MKQKTGVFPACFHEAASFFSQSYEADGQMRNIEIQHREEVTFLSFHDRIGDRNKPEGGEKDDRMYCSRRRRVYRGSLPLSHRADPCK